MPSLDTTLTWALPVHVAQLGGHFEAYIKTLPALNALRACNRFGKGPQCFINKLPVELVQSIAHHHILPIREAKHKLWKNRLECYGNTCELIGHFDRWELEENYWQLNSPLGHMSPTPDPPNDEELEAFCYDANYFPDEIHDSRRESWEARIKDFDSKYRPVLLKNFGLDIWLSRVCLGASSPGWVVESANTTVTYLVLPDRAVHKREWHRHLTEDGYVESTYESGYGMAVSMDQHSTANDMQKFKRVMSALELDVYTHETQDWEDTILCASTKEAEQTLVAADSPASYPRPMLLVRNKVEGDYI